MKKIAIIGSGIFWILNCTHTLSKKDKVHIYEKHESILCGASRANQMRFHMDAITYPRSTKTLREISKHKSMNFKIFLE